MAESAGRYVPQAWDPSAASCSTRYPGARWQRYETAEQAGWSSAALAAARRFSDDIGSAAVMVVFDGCVLTHWGQIERRYQCHSMRKSLLSALYGEPVATGTIDLDETLGSIGIDDLSPLTESEKRATVADLLKSRSGVYLPAAYEDQQAVTTRPARGSHVPGTHWHYNNWDFNVLGTIFGRKTGDDVFRAFERRVAVPLQMEDFEARHGHRWLEPQKSQHPACTFRMSTRDLARVGLLYLREGKWRGRSVVPADWVHAGTRSYSETHAGGYGYSWWIERGRLGEEGTYTAAGWGGHRLYVVPSTQLVIVHRADTYLNQQVAARDVNHLAEMILDARTGPPSPEPCLVGMPEPERAHEPAAFSTADIAAFSGDYRQGSEHAIVRADGNRLELQLKGGWFRLMRGSSATFGIEDLPHRLEFDLDAEGKATGMRLWRPIEIRRAADG